MNLQNTILIMNGLFYFLCFVAFFILVIVRLASKVKNITESGNTSGIPNLNKPITEKDVLSESWKNIKLPEAEKAVNSIKEEALKKSAITDFNKEGGDKPVCVDDVEKRVSEEQENNVSEYAFENLDDVKKAIVWSEIIKRKY